MVISQLSRWRVTPRFARNSPAWLKRELLGCIGRRTRVGDTIELEGRTLTVTAMDRLRVAKVWLSTPVQRSQEHKGHEGHRDMIARQYREALRGLLRRWPAVLAKNHGRLGVFTVS